MATASDGSGAEVARRRRWTAALRLCRLGWCRRAVRSGATRIGARAPTSTSVRQVSGVWLSSVVRDLAWPRYRGALRMGIGSVLQRAGRALSAATHAIAGPPLLAERDGTNAQLRRGIARMDPLRGGAARVAHGGVATDIGRGAQGGAIDEGHHQHGVPVVAPTRPEGCVTAQARRGGSLGGPWPAMSTCTSFRDRLTEGVCPCGERACCKAVEGGHPVLPR